MGTKVFWFLLLLLKLSEWTSSVDGLDLVDLVQEAKLNTLLSRLRPSSSHLLHQLLN